MALIIIVFLGFVHQLSYRKRGAHIVYGVTHKNLWFNHGQGYEPEKKNLHFAPSLLNENTIFSEATLTGLSLQAIVYAVNVYLYIYIYNTYRVE